MKKVLVTSGSKGLGEGVVEILLSNGYKVDFTSSSVENIKKVENELNGPVRGFKCDIFDERDVDEIIKMINREQYDCLVINSPGPKAGEVFQITPDDWKEHFNSIFLNPIRIMESAAKWMMEKKFGRIAVITSVSVKKPIDNLLISNCLRAALTSYVKSLAKKVASYNVTVNTVAPGYTLTDRVNYLLNQKVKSTGVTYEEAYNSIANMIPMKRIAEVEEFANAVKFLISDEASYITGTTLIVDGGLTEYPF